MCPSRPRPTPFCSSDPSPQRSSAVGPSTHHSMSVSVVLFPSAVKFRYCTDPITWEETTDFLVVPGEPLGTSPFLLSILHFPHGNSFNSIPCGLMDITGEWAADLYCRLLFSLEWFLHRSLHNENRKRISSLRCSVHWQLPRPLISAHLLARRKK